ANSWDYGPLGAELKNNIKQEWWRRFVQARTDMVGVETALLMNTKVWEASGHLKEFSDPLVECKNKECHERFRTDQLVLMDGGGRTNGAEGDWQRMGEFQKLLHSNPAEAIVKYPNEAKSSFWKCPYCGGTIEITAPTQFNLMLKTFLGPASGSANEVYFRPETAQGMFVNFKNILETTRRRLPFGIAQMGKAFRNEITPGNFIFRTREFEQMEIEYFVRSEEWEKWFAHWLSEMKRWLTDLGVAETRLHFVDIPEGERAHYSKRTVDIEYDYPFGQKELYGLAYRTDFDLKNHMKASGEDLRYTDPDTKEKFLPHVIEPTWGVDRSVLVAMLEAYREEEIANGKSQMDERESSSAEASEDKTDTRIVLKFPKWLAPVKVAILPLSKKEELSSVARELHAKLAEHFVCEYDETQSIGKRYRRQDEIGTPYSVTVDFETKGDGKVTVRDRDTMKQDRVSIAELIDYLKEGLATRPFGSESLRTEEV
ncbi:MAG: glycine--tRNA ligase, partial [bacterium]|nr:glycine--tRNA ligase [bacterium]